MLLKFFSHDLSVVSLTVYSYILSTETEVTKQATSFVELKKNKTLTQLALGF